LFAPEPVRDGWRRNLSWRARLKDSHGQIIDCRAIHRSTEGLAIISHLPVRGGERVQVAVQLHDGHTGEARTVLHRAVVVASVLTQRGFRIGLQIHDPLAELFNEIPNVIRCSEADARRRVVDAKKGLREKTANAIRAMTAYRLPTSPHA
jgi:hypothetical protein